MTARQVLAPLAAAGVIALAGCQTGSTPGAGAASPGTTSAEAPKAAGFSQKPKAEPVLPRGYTCCNLHRYDDWISDANYQAWPLVPVGTPAYVKKYGRHRAHIDAGGKALRLGHDYGRKQESLEQWTAKMIVAEDPKPRIATWPKDVQDAIEMGQLAIGMTREQAIVAVGYPLTNENPSIDARRWIMWASESAQYQVLWNEEGRIKEVVADPTTRHSVLHRP
jgi:hypothetical protein